jgi:hypothetical protein
MRGQIGIVLFLEEFTNKIMDLTFHYFSYLKVVLRISLGATSPLF